jgi:hypothetical protein
MNVGGLRRVSATWSSFSGGTLARLIRLFLGRVFHRNSDSGEGELGFSVGLMLALLPLPGGFYAVLLFEKYSTLLQWMRGAHVADPIAAAMPEQYFFIVLSMVVTGAVAVWRWDALFPDRRDYTNLSPLPVPARTIFLANLIAILALALLLAIDVNAASALLFPLAVGASIDSFGFFVHFVWVHATVVAIASLFSFFAVLLMMGLLMTVVPYPAFRRFSLYFRSAIVTCLVAALATSFAVPVGLRQLPNSFLRFIPPVWFLGLSQSLQHSANSHLVNMGQMAVIGFGCVLIGAVMVYTVSYRKMFMRIPETVGIAGPTMNPGASWIYRALDRTVLKSPFQRAGYRFVMKVLFRSEQHSMIIGGFSALGFVLASQFLFSSLNSTGSRILSVDLLSVPLVLSYCVILGTRMAFEVPAELRANWTFRLNVAKGKNAATGLALKVILSFVLPWVVIFVIPIYGYVWGPRAGLLQAFVCIAWPLLLAKVLLLRFRKLPFTCSYPPFRDSAVVLALLYVLGFFVFVVLTAQLEYWALSNPVAAAVLIAMAGGSWFVLSRLGRDAPETDGELIFEDNLTASFELLDLGRGS